jgi:hypothetical protein
MSVRTATPVSLESGDHLTRDEFHRCYCARPDIKKEAFRRNGVHEYVVWRVLDGAIDWFRLRDGAYVPLAPDADGVVESDEFPGLRLHLPSMLAGDLVAVLARLQPRA